MPSISVKFYLEAKSKGDPHKLLPIFLYIRHRGKTIKTFTERKCTTHGWNVAKGRANYRKFNTATELNGFLSDLEEAASNLFNYNNRNAIITTKAHVLSIVAQISGNGGTKNNLADFADDYVQNAKFAATTQKAYKTTVKTLREYALKRKKSIHFVDIDLNFYDDFTSYLWKEKKLNDNSVGKHIKIVKALMSNAFERDLHHNLHFKKKSFRVFKRDADAIYLNDAELARLLNLDLKNNERLEKVRDTFYIASWTGLRFSDLIRVSKEKFLVEDGIQIFRIESEKTNDVVKIPISPHVKPLLEKYDYTLPVITNQKMNEYLKEVGDLAKFHEEIVEISETKKGVTERKKVTKSDLITTHTARRSFASNLYLKGVPTQSIMAITGHKTEKSFLAYIKLSNMEKIRAIDKHFKKSHKLKMKVA